MNMLIVYRIDEYSIVLSTINCTMRGLYIYRILGLLGLVHNQPKPTTSFTTVDVSCCDLGFRLLATAFSDFVSNCKLKDPWHRQKVRISINCITKNKNWQKKKKRFLVHPDLGDEMFMTRTWRLHLLALSNLHTPLARARLTNKCYMDFSCMLGRGVSRHHCITSKT